MVSMTQRSQTPPVSLTPQSLYDTVESDKFFVMISQIERGVVAEMRERITVNPPTV